MGSSFRDKAIEVSLCRGTFRKSQNPRFKNIFPIIYTHLLFKIKTRATYGSVYSLCVVLSYVKMFICLKKAFIRKEEKSDEFIRCLDSKDKYQNVNSS
jgi:hypothetical protein